MTADHERHADWDAAYVLGSLSPADRREYETHLEVCDRCRRAVADLAPMPGLLGRVDDATGLGLLEADSSEAGPRPDLVARIHLADQRRRRRGLRTRLAVGLAAAAAITAAVVLPLGLLQPPVAASRTVAMSGEQSIPLTATVTMTKRGWGTQLDIDCAYQRDDGGRDWSYELAVTGDDGETSTVSSWTALHGQDIKLTGATSIPYDRIRSLEIRALPGGQPVLHSDVQQG